MKKLLVLLISASLLFISCKKRFPDGPLISFRSVSKRVAGTWELENYLVNGYDSATIINNILRSKCTFYLSEFDRGEASNGNYYFQWGKDTTNYFYREGFYIFGTDMIDGDGGGVIHNTSGFNISFTSIQEFQILKCEYKTMWLGFQFQGRNYEMHFNNLSK